MHGFAHKNDKNYYKIPLGSGRKTRSGYFYSDAPVKRPGGLKTEHVQ